MPRMHLSLGLIVQTFMGWNSITRCEVSQLSVSHHVHIIYQVYLQLEV
jgi:hypothetical protein